jgi:hypothetical protein
MNQRVYKVGMKILEDGLAVRKNVQEDNQVFRHLPSGNSTMILSFQVILIKHQITKSNHAQFKCSIINFFVPTTEKKKNLSVRYTGLLFALVSLF